MKTVQKVLACAVSAALAITGTITGVASVASSADSSVKYEFEDGTLNGSSVMYGSDASNGAYVQMTDSAISVTVSVDTDDMYDIVIRCAGIGGDKLNDIYVDGASQGSFSIPEGSSGSAVSEWHDVTAAQVKLSAGSHEIRIEPSWGWSEFDYLTLSTTVVPEVYATDTWPCDPNASDETVKLMEFLSSVYGDYIISGQQEYYGTSREDEFEYIYKNTGKYPVIRGFDLGDNCPLYAWDDGVTDRIINWVNNRGGIATVSWHICVPTDFASYNYGDSIAWSETAVTYGVNTDFNTSNVLVSGTKENQYFLLCVEYLAKDLQKVQDAGVSILFRPFHEAEGSGGTDGSGSWFWWGMDGCDVYVQLYQYLYELLTEEYGLHNLIWEFNSYTYNNSEYWYPGDEYVDIIGYDKYNYSNSTGINESAVSSTFYSLIEMYDNTKMIAMMENDTIPSVDNMVDEGAMWLYFMPWYEEHLYQYNNVSTLNAIYNSEYVITLDEFQTMYADFEPTGTTGTYRDTTSRETIATTTVDQVYAEGDGVINATIKRNTFTFNQAIGDTLYLIYDITDESTGGCVSFSLDVNGTWYWVSFEWVASGTGEQHIQVDLNDPYEVLNTDTGLDETNSSVIQQVCQAVQQLTSGDADVWWGDGTFEGAYILTDGATVVTTDSSSSSTVKEAVNASVSASSDGYNFSFDTAMGDNTLYLILDTDSSVSYANGCAGFSVNVNGTDYWVSYMWEIAGSSTVAIDLGNTSAASVSVGTTTVTDSAEIAAAVAAVQELTGGTVQIWWANNYDGNQVDNSNVVLTGAYILTDTESGSGNEPDENPDSSGETSTEPVLPDESGNDDDDNDGGNNDSSASVTLYGDVTLDGTLNLADVILIGKAAAGNAYIEAGSTQAANGDVNANGGIDSSDAIILMQFELGIVNSLPKTS